MTAPQPSDELTQAERLYAALRGQNGADQGPEQELAAALQAMNKSQQPGRSFAVSLEAQLAAAHTVSKHTPQAAGRTRSFAGALGWAMLAALLLFGLAWVLRNVLPGPQPATTQPAIETANPVVIPGVQPTATPLPTRTPAAEPTAVEKVYSTMLLNLGTDGGLVLRTSLPEGQPQEAGVYQLAPAEKMSVDNTLSLGQMFGLAGPVYNFNQNPDTTSYMLTDGRARLTVNDSPDWFDYTKDVTAPFKRAAQYPPTSDLVRTATAFMESRGLLEDTYQVITSEVAIESLRFAQTLEGHPVTFDIVSNPGVIVTFDEQGQVVGVNAGRMRYEKLGAFPIISAEQAWNKITDPNDTSGTQATDMFIKPTSDFQLWERTYPDDAQVEVFAYISYYPAVETGQAPLFLLNGFPMTGNLTGLEKVVTNDPSQGTPLMQVVGRFYVGDDGVRRFETQSWQKSPMLANLYLGTLVRQGDQAFIEISGERLRLPNLPADVPEGVELQVNGVKVDGQPALMEWLSISNGEGGGGGGGGGSFLELNLNPDPNSPPPTAVPMPTPMAQPGSRVDGLQGDLWVTVHQYNDGTRTFEASIAFAPSAEWPDGLSTYLTGIDLAQLEPYHLLPIRVWGEFVEGANYNPDIKIERFEPVYPGLKAETLTGTAEVVTIDGREVYLFTTETGETYVLKTSIESPDPERAFFQPGEKLQTFGVAFPDQTIGDYPIFNDRGLNYAGPDPHSGALLAQPPVIQEAGDPGQPRIAYIEKVELVFLTQDPRYAPPDPGVINYVQPVWRFSGHYADGRTFEILVQALVSQYLR
jgi:hypothetical protein